LDFQELLSLEMGGTDFLIKILFPEFGSLPNEMNKFGMTALHHAAVAGNPEVVQLLLECGGNVNQVI